MTVFQLADKLISVTSYLLHDVVVSISEGGFTVFITPISRFKKSGRSISL